MNSFINDDLYQYIKGIFDIIRISPYNNICNNKNIQSLKEKINSISIYFDGIAAHKILLYIIDIFMDLIDRDKQPWSYKHIVRIFSWIVNKIIFHNPLITIEIYKFGCMIGNYKLIKYAFIQGINPNHIFIGDEKKNHSYSCNGLQYVMYTMITKTPLINIYDLFIEYGLHMNIMTYNFSNKNWTDNLLHRALSSHVFLAEKMLKMNCDINIDSLYFLAGWIGFISPKKKKIKDTLKYIINTVIEKTITKYGNVDSYICEIGSWKLTPLIKLFETLSKYHTCPSYKFVNEWYVYNKETIVEYFIKKLLLANTDITYAHTYLKTNIYMDSYKRHHAHINKMMNNICKRPEVFCRGS